MSSCYHTVRDKLLDALTHFQPSLLQVLCRDTKESRDLADQHTLSPFPLKRISQQYELDKSHSCRGKPARMVVNIRYKSFPASVEGI